MWPPMLLLAHVWVKCGDSRHIRVYSCSRAIWFSGPKSASSRAMRVKKQEKSPKTISAYRWLFFETCCCSRGCNHSLYRSVRENLYPTYVLSYLSMFSTVHPVFFLGLVWITPWSDNKTNWWTNGHCWPGFQILHISSRFWGGKIS